MVALVLSLIPITGLIQPTRFTSIPLNITISNGGIEDLTYPKLANTRCSVMLYPIVSTPSFSDPYEGNMMPLEIFAADPPHAPNDNPNADDLAWLCPNDTHLLIRHGTAAVGTMNVAVGDGSPELEFDVPYEVAVSLGNEEAMVKTHRQRRQEHGGLEEFLDDASITVMMEGVAVQRHTDRLLDWRLKEVYP